MNFYEASKGNRNLVLKHIYNIGLNLGIFGENEFTYNDETNYTHIETGRTGLTYKDLYSSFVSRCYIITVESMELEESEKNYLIDMIISKQIDIKFLVYINKSIIQLKKEGLSYFYIERILKIMVNNKDVDIMARFIQLKKEGISDFYIERILKIMVNNNDVDIIDMVIQLKKEGKTDFSIDDILKIMVNNKDVDIMARFIQLKKEGLSYFYIERILKIMVNNKDVDIIDIVIQLKKEGINEGHYINILKAFLNPIITIDIKYLNSINIKETEIDIVLKVLGLL